MLYKIWKPCDCFLWNNCLLISLCSVSHFSSSISPRTQRIDPQCNQVKIFREMLGNNLSVTQHGECFLGWGVDLSLFVLYKDNLWIFSTIIFEKYENKGDFQQTVSQAWCLDAPPATTTLVKVWFRMPGSRPLWRDEKGRENQKLRNMAGVWHMF